jgi:hypothetical protein
MVCSSTGPEGTCTQAGVSYGSTLLCLAYPQHESVTCTPQAGLTGLGYGPPEFSSVLPGPVSPMASDAPLRVLFSGPFNASAIAPWMGLGCVGDQFPIGSVTHARPSQMLDPTCRRMQRVRVLPSNSAVLQNESH